MIFVDNKTSADEVLGVRSNLTVVREFKGNVVDSIEIFFKTSAGPGSVAKYHLIEHQSKTPNIGFCCIRLILQKLRGHVDRSSTDIVEFFMS